MEASFADESWESNFWFEHIILAHINHSQNLDWFFELFSILRREHPELKEFKAHTAIEIMSRLDLNARKRIWQKLKDAIIVVQEPKAYAKAAGVFILPDGSLNFRFEGKDFLVPPGHKDFKPLNELLQKTLSKWMLFDSPISRIGFSLSEIPLLHPKADYFSPDNILALIGKKDSRKEVMGVVKLAAKLCSAFIDVLDDNARKRIIEQFYEYGGDFLLAVPQYHQDLLKRAISSDRFFDTGHAASTAIIKSCFDAIDESLTYPGDSPSISARGKVGELDFKESVYIQACDWAGGIARSIYDREGIKGLKEKFKCVIFNGDIV